MFVKTNHSYNIPIKNISFRAFDFFQRNQTMTGNRLISHQTPLVSINQLDFILMFCPVCVLTILNWQHCSNYSILHQSTWPGFLLAHIQIQVSISICIERLQLSLKDLFGHCYCSTPAIVQVLHQSWWLVLLLHRSTPLSTPLAHKHFTHLRQSSGI